MALVGDARTAIETSGHPNCDDHRTDLQRPLNIDFSRPVSANSGRPRSPLVRHAATPCHCEGNNLV